MRAMTLEEMKAVELEIMDEIDAICRQHGLTYFLGYGAASSAPFATAASSPGTTTWTSSCRVTTTNSSSLTSTSGVQSKNYALTFCRNDTSVYQFVKIIDTRTSVKERYVSASYKTGALGRLPFPSTAYPRTPNACFDAMPGSLRRWHSPCPIRRTAQHPCASSQRNCSTP